MKVGIKKYSLWATRWWKLRAHTVINFESVPACDRRTRTDTPPMPISWSSIAERDKKERGALLRPSAHHPSNAI